MNISKVWYGTEIFDHMSFSDNEKWYKKLFKHRVLPIIADYM